jgi:hypothetical protein
MAAEKKPGPASTTKQEPKFLFGTINYVLFALSALLIVVGFMMMSGGGSEDPNVFNPEIFSSTRITLAPIMVLLGFTVSVVAIMLKPKQ